MRDTYRNIVYMGRVQTFRYFGTQENPFGDDIHLYNGDPSDDGSAATLSNKTLDNLLTIQETYSYLEFRKMYQEMGQTMAFDKSTFKYLLDADGMVRGIRRNEK